MITKLRILEGIDLIVARLFADDVSPDGWEPHEWSYVRGLAHAAILQALQDGSMARIGYTLRRATTKAQLQALTTADVHEAQVLSYLATHPHPPPIAPDIAIGTNLSIQSIARVVSNLVAKQLLESVILDD